MHNIQISKKTMVIFGISITFISVTLAFIFLSRNSTSQSLLRKKNQLRTETTAKKTISGYSAITAIDPPLVAFQRWTGFNAPRFTQDLNSMVFKQNFNQSEIQILAQKLDVADSVKNDKKVFTSYAITADKTSFMVFNMQTGEFVYNSTKGVALPSEGTIDEKSYAFLQNLGWYDPSIKVSATYKDRKKAGITYVELHRDWTYVKAPILNPVGLLNIPLEQPLSALGLSTSIKSTPEDTDIYQTSDNREGMARSTDFNTITLAVDDVNQTVRTIKSTIRPLASLPAPVQIISYENAVEKLLNKQYSFIYTTPAGSGEAVDWKNIYPGNLASAQEAKVTESLIAYLEESPTVIQNDLKPFYIFRGYAQLDTGYRVTFTAAVPAIEDTLSSTGFSWAKNAYAAEDATQKQGTFDSYIEPTKPISPDSQSNLPDFSCRPGSGELNPVYASAGIKFGWAPYTYWKGELRNDRNGYWYYIPDTGTTASMVEGNLDAIITALQETTDAKIRNERKKIQYDINQNLPTRQNLDESNGDTNTGSSNDTTQKQGTFYTEKPNEEIILSNVFETIQDSFGVCPIRLTGSSPTVFVYGKEGENIYFSPTNTYTYADPPLQSENRWNIRVDGKHNLLMNNMQRPYLYYEYDRVSFKRPTAGWHISKNNIKEFVHTIIGPQMGLNALEIERTIYELTHAAQRVNYPRLFIGIINPDEVEKKLPVSTDVQYIQRIHFYVGRTQGTVYPPVITPINRVPESYIVEIGSHGE